MDKCRDNSYEDPAPLEKAILPWKMHLRYKGWQM